ncbi:unnamed protein product [Urochloa decumbens]|uniref:Uncharacterized protein n=1 Tax=Urochloa decumbens TaxID=240449 RepID=A0ABC9B419_9POAL
MWGRNRSRHGRRQRDDDARRPPLPPPDHGHRHCPVPLWEREFCSYVGNISWQRFCETKRYVSIFNSLDHWDDSGAFENFQNAKARFWADYHRQPCDIPLPDPDLYIDMVDHHCNVDPELVADLDKLRLPVDSDSCAVVPTGWDDENGGADNKCTQNQSGNWDIYVEKPAEVLVNGWDSWEPSPGSNATWTGNNESSNKWGYSNSGWGAALENRSWSNNQYASNNRNGNFYGASNNQYASNNRYNNLHQRNNNKQRDHDERFHRSRWQDHRGKKKVWRPVAKSACQNGQGIEGGS